MAIAVGSGDNELKLRAEDPGQLSMVRSREKQIRLWTFQQRRLLSSIQSGGRFEMPWVPLTPSQRLAYEWMRARLTALIGVKVEAAPIWCWSSSGRSTATVTEIGEALLSEDDLTAGISLIELNVPRDMALLSSYSVWNEFLDVVMDRGRIPADESEWMRMFAVSERPTSDDHIQAVIPYIELHWINTIDDFDFAN